MRNKTNWEGTQVRGGLTRMGAGCLLACALCWTAALPVCAAEGSAVDREVFIEELISVAVEELGYTQEKSGYTKYAEWGGENKYGEWCSEFTSWCVDQADQRLGTNFLSSVYPMQTACITGVKWLTERGRYVSATGTLKGYGAQWHLEDGVPLTERPYVPQRGDFIYFEWYKYNRIDHVGIVESVEVKADGRVLIHTIEGNNRAVDYVKRFTYPLDDPSIRAYGITREDIGTELMPRSEGELVRRLQQRLIDAGYLKSDADGVFGGKTIAAIKAFQAATGLEQTGIADRATQEALGVGFEG